MISIQAFLRQIQAIADLNPSYQEGGSGKDGTCDCIGLIIGAIRRAGGTWKGIHGSNWAARNAMVRLVRDPKLEMGLLLYKAREPGQVRYALPKRYQGHPDLLDYYHVGVVTGLDPLLITHCTTGSGGSGIAIDTRLGDWLYGGKLKGLVYEREDFIMVEKMTVYASNGKTVNLRAGASQDSTRLTRVPIGTLVEVAGKIGDWYQVNYGGKTGYMQAGYLKELEQPADEPAIESPDRPEAAILAEKREVLIALWQQMGEILGVG